MKPLLAHAAYRGRYQFTRRKAATLEIVEQTPWFDNVILNAGLNQMGSGEFGTRCAVGTSGVAPAVNQTQLFGYLARSTNVLSVARTAAATPPYFGRTVTTWRFDAGVATGTLAEVGIGWTSADVAGNLFSRALILDANGNPTTITVLADEILDISYELRLYPNIADKTFSVVIGGTTYNCISRPSIVTDDNAWGPYLNNPVSGRNYPTFYNGQIGTVLQSPSGNSSGNIAYSNAPYVEGSLTRVINMNASITQGNLAGGIKSIRVPFFNVGYFQTEFDVAIPKTGDSTLSLQAQVTWGRYSP